MVKWKERESKHGPMEIGMKVCGKMINNTVQDCFIMQKLIKRLQKNGEMANDGHGIRLLNLPIRMLYH